jgi:hypothetical protein
MVSGLADGPHSLVFQAVDAAGNAAQPVTYGWTIVTVAQVTLGAVSPSGSLVNSRSISIAFSSTDATSFVCSLDGAAAASCTSPAQYANLADGSHSFQVQALNPIGQPGPAASHGWTVDATAPVVTLTSESPSWSPTASQTETIAFSATDSQSITFACSLDGAAATACTSPWTLSGLSSASAQISWTSSVPANSQVQYGTNGTFTQATAVDPSFVTSHTVNLTGLSPFTLYNVRAVSVDQDGRSATSSTITFRTTH